VKRLGQSEVIELLEKSDEPLTRTEIANKLDARPTFISKVLKKLCDNGEVRCRKISYTLARKRYGSLRSLKVYFVK